MAAEYAFKGKVINLYTKHYDDFYSSFYSGRPEEEFYNKLVNLDDWMAKKRICRKKWFFLLVNLLDKERQEHERNINRNISK